MFEVGDILECTQGERGVYVNVGEEVILKTIRSSCTNLDIEVIPLWYSSKEEGQYACSENFKLKTRPQK